MLTLRDHIGGDPVLRLGSPAKPLAEREKDARKRQQQDDRVRQMVEALGETIRTVIPHAGAEFADDLVTTYDHDDGA